MKTAVYCIFDVVADEPIVIGTSSTDSAFIRQQMPYLNKMNPNFETDYKVYKIGYFVTSEMSLEPIDKVEVSWSCYNSEKTE